jgi:hypothetical protein
VSTNSAPNFTPSQETLDLLELNKSKLSYMADNVPPYIDYYHHDGDDEYDKGFRAGWLARSKCERSQCF